MYHQGHSYKETSEEKRKYSTKVVAVVFGGGVFGVIIKFGRIE